MTTNIQLVVGLGNPGPEYQKTRHNAGMWFVEQLASTHHISLRAEKKYFGIYGKGHIAGQDVHLLMPTTFMNKSGQAVAALANFYRIQPNQILVAHDELDLAVGQCKVKLGGGHGGHNGLRDIIKCLGNNKEFYRLRIGIDHPGHKDRVTGYVLGKAPNAEQQKLDAVIDESIRCFDIWQQQDLLKAQQRLHAFKA